MCILKVLHTQISKKITENHVSKIIELPVRSSYSNVPFSNVSTSLLCLSLRMYAAFMNTILIVEPAFTCKYSVGGSCIYNVPTNFTQTTQLPDFTHMHTGLHCWFEQPLCMGTNEHCIH